MFMRADRGMCVHVPQSPCLRGQVSPCGTGSVTDDETNSRPRFWWITRRQHSTLDR